jgi:hypothetical protein
LAEAGPYYLLQEQVKERYKMTTFDFQDGKGPVPAHQHSNGGGWVADTAKVYGNAKVSDAKVSGDAIVTSTLLTANRSDGYTFAIFKCQDDRIRISAGCRYFTIPEAIEHWNKTRGGTKLGMESINTIGYLRTQFELVSGDE